MLEIVYSCDTIFNWLISETHTRCNTTALSLDIDLYLSLKNIYVHVRYAHIKICLIYCTSIIISVKPVKLVSNKAVRKIDVNGGVIGLWLNYKRYSTLRF